MANIIKKGWLYAVSSDNYAHDGFVKLGFCEKPGMTAEEVKLSLCQRYGTSLVNPRVIWLAPVSHPKQAEKEVFALLKDYRVAKEIFKADFEQFIKPTLIWAEKEFQINEPYEIRENVLHKLLSRLSKKERKIVYDINFMNDFRYWLTNNSNNLHPNNRNKVYAIAQMCGPCIVNSSMDWHKSLENNHVVNVRKSEYRLFCNERNWDRKDPLLHLFLKGMLDRL
jgi:hypothetical protein